MSVHLTIILSVEGLSPARSQAINLTKDWLIQSVQIEPKYKIFI